MRSDPRQMPLRSPSIANAGFPTGSHPRQRPLASATIWGPQTLKDFLTNIGIVLRDHNDGIEFLN